MTRPSAIMRRDGTIRGRAVQFATRVGAVLLTLLGSATWHPPRGIAGAADDETAAAADTTGAWLPLPVEEIESPERLAEPPFRGDVAIRGDVSNGRLTSARYIAAVHARLLTVTTARIEVPGPAARQTVLVSGFGERFRLGAGRVVVRDAPVLLGEAVGFSRRLRRPLEPRSSAPRWEAPRGAASPGVDGVSLAIATARDSRGREPAWALWAVGGRSADDGEPLFAAGMVRHEERWEATASFARRFGSVAARWRGRSSAVAIEVLLSPEQGPALLASATAEAPGSPLRFGARWRRRAGERRPVAAELTAEVAAGRAGGARLAWRPWSASGSAFADDGAVEIDARFRAPGAPAAARIRIGRRGGEGSAAARAAAGAVGGSGGAAAVPERYFVLDVPVAGERGRLVSLLASRRERGSAEGRAIGTTVGARARLPWCGRAGVSAQVEAARTRGSADIGGGAAWSSAFAASGEEMLTSRGSGGVYVTVSGWIRAGPVVLRLHARDGEGERGGRPLAATIWMEWSGSAMRDRPPGDAGSGG